MGFAIFVIVAGIIGLYLLGNSSSSSSIPSDSITQKKHRELVESLNREQRKKEEELTRARKFFEAKMKSRSGSGSSVIRNVAGRVKNPLDWFVVTRAQDQISEAEKLIAGELSKYKVDWYREVAFEGLKFTNYGYARYDFLILTPKGIHMIEYDGRSSHNTKEQKAKDLLKDQFCFNNGIPLTRYNRQHYYHLGREIALLMTQYNIQKK